MFLKKNFRDPSVAVHVKDECRKCFITVTKAFINTVLTRLAKLIQYIFLDLSMNYLYNFCKHQLHSTDKMFII